MLSKQFMYWKKYFFNVYEFLKEKIHAFVGKLGNRCFCWFLSAILELIQVSTSMASSYKSLSRGRDSVYKRGGDARRLA